MDKPEFQHLPPWKWAAKHPWGAAAAAAACASVMICISVLLGMEGSSAWMLSVVILPVVFLLVGVHNSFRFKDYLRNLDQHHNE
jgi:hypothetical protein